MRRRPQAEQQEAATEAPAARLDRGAVTLPTSLIYKGRPVTWRDGVLYVDGRAIGRRPQP